MRRNDSPEQCHKSLIKFSAHNDYIPEMKEKTKIKNRYYKFSQFLKERYGEKVWKIPVDAGFSCPNKDKETGEGGCIFCRLDSFSQVQSQQGIDVGAQIREGLCLGRERFGLKKFIVYFQASTNTFAPVPLLRKLFEQAITYDGVVGLSISTRPDCLPKPVLSLLQELSLRTDLWVELGLQSIHDRTLKILNRRHNYADYLRTVEKLRSLPLRICTHLMLGLPGESRDDLLETAHEIGCSGIDEVKLHPLLVLKDTPLANMFFKGEFTALDSEQYISLACDFIERMPPKMVMQRLTAEAPADILIAPQWTMNKMRVLTGIENELKRRQTRQGDKYNHKKMNV
ncbi:MAG: TIGR01212 family radical SAM protein [Calditrichaeota bacterium]|nr:TIGR01212 family radical SAM protein [Calditrichota bacterium]